jgi:hypothetical protein
MHRWVRQLVRKLTEELAQSGRTITMARKPFEGPSIEGFNS